MAEQPDSLLAEFHELVTKLRKFTTEGGEGMKYQLHDIDLGLWGWVKERATVAGLTINQYITTILMDARTQQEKASLRREKYKKHPHKTLLP